MVIRFKFIFLLKELKYKKVSLRQINKCFCIVFSDSKIKF